MTHIQMGGKGTFAPVLCGQSGPVSSGQTLEGGFLGHEVWLGLEGQIWWP